MKKPGLSIGVMVFNEGDVLLLKPAEEDHYMIPCGPVKLMETAQDAVIRITYQDTGLKVYDLEFLTFLEFVDLPEYEGMHFVGLEYKCRSQRKDARLGERFIEHIWISPKEALKLKLEVGARMLLQYYLFGK